MWLRKKENTMAVDPAVIPYHPITCSNGTAFIWISAWRLKDAAWTQRRERKKSITERPFPVFWVWLFIEMQAVQPSQGPKSCEDKQHPTCIPSGIPFNWFILWWNISPRSRATLLWDPFKKYARKKMGIWTNYTACVFQGYSDKAPSGDCKTRFVCNWEQEQSRSFLLARVISY